MPRRDVRGTPEQDALRRDLTIGAMLLQISRGAAPAEPVASLAAADAAADGLEWRLLDYYGGLADLQAGVLRSPYPADRPLPEIWEVVMRCEHDVEMANAIGLFPPPGPTAHGPVQSGGAAAAPSPPPVAGLLPPPREGEEDQLLQVCYHHVLPPRATTTCNPRGKNHRQVIWWVKVLRDDPLRVLRALRFSAKLGFYLHDTFWLAVPFALTSLQGKVAGSRKVVELLKIGRAGRTPLLEFLQLAFGRRLPAAVPAAAGTEALDECSVHAQCTLATLAPGLFGGADPRGEARFLSTPHGFDASRMRAAAAALPASLDEEEALGTGLAAAVYACQSPWGMPTQPPTPSPSPTPSASAAPPREGRAERDAAAAAAATEALAQVSVACDGLCASNDVRAAAEAPLYCVTQLLSPRETQGMHALFAEYASRSRFTSDLGEGYLSRRALFPIGTRWAAARTARPRSSPRWCTRGRPCGSRRR